MPGSHAPRPRKNRDTLHNEKWLRDHYEVQRLTSYDIARLLDCAVPSVLHALNKFGIPIRRGREAKIGRPIRAFRCRGTTSADRTEERAHQAQAQLKLEMVAAYGGACACCGETIIEFLSLDHIGGGGFEDRRTIGSMGVWRRLKALGWPKDKYRILCMNCNVATRLGRVCPHQTAIERHSEPVTVA